MTTEELTIILNCIGYSPLMAVLKTVDPDLEQVIEAITFIRGHGFGDIKITIADGKVMYIEPTPKINVR